MYSEEDYIQLSSIQHYIFCPRQCGLIHIDALWAENLFTARGRLMHEKADSGEDESRGDKEIIRSLNIYSKRLGISGKCDVVEMLSREDSTVAYPVEYKSGKPKADISDTAQLCAQALCLEEMMNLPVRQAAIFYGKPRRRLVVEISDELRQQTEEVIRAIHDMIESRKVPQAVYQKKCDLCSLNDMCMPKTGSNKLTKYIKELYNNNEEAP